MCKSLLLARVWGMEGKSQERSPGTPSRCSLGPSFPFASLERCSSGQWENGLWGSSAFHCQPLLDFIRKVFTFGIPFVPFGIHFFPIICDVIVTLQGRPSLPLEASGTSFLQVFEQQCHGSSRENKRLHCASPWLISHRSFVTPRSYDKILGCR